MPACLIFFGVVWASAGYAQFPTPAPSAAPAPDVLFRNQCGTCHTLSANEGPRQGPPLSGVFGRRVGGVPNYKYSAGFANVDFVWDTQRLDAWLTNPRTVIPGTVMIYRQAYPTTRQTIIDWLKEQH
jgi:cytochrome c